MGNCSKNKMLPRIVREVRIQLAMIATRKLMVLWMRMANLSQYLLEDRKTKRFSQVILMQPWRK